MAASWMTDMEHFIARAGPLLREGASVWEEQQAVKQSVRFLRDVAFASGPSLTRFEQNFMFDIKSLAEDERNRLSDVLAKVLCHPRAAFALGDCGGEYPENLMGRLISTRVLIIASLASLHQLIDDEGPRAESDEVFWSLLWKASTGEHVSTHGLTAVASFVPSSKGTTINTSGTQRVFTNPLPSLL